MFHVLELLAVVPLLPFLSYFILGFAGRRLPRRAVAVIGTAFTGISAALTIVLMISFIYSPPPGYAYRQLLWQWMWVAGFNPAIGLYLDPLSLIWILVVTFVGFFILLYSVEFMREEEGYSRFFAYMNLFIGSMLILVLADNLLLLYLGWEGVGLCSYLLIGFWYKNPDNGIAAQKAFIVTRVGDAIFAVGLFLLFDNLGTLRIQEMLQRAAEQWPAGSTLPLAASLLLLGGAVGKSAQIPLQTWLIDAMAGPSPVSALIHAATMVTAGVYLIARNYVIFELAPAAMFIVAVTGAGTLLISAFSGLAQVDIKRVLAYSTISQIGYMIFALGIGAWAAGVFHFMIQAFFKALLFLGAGVIILTHHHEHNIFKMGGIRKQLPLTFWTFLIGAASLAAIPVVTAGWYSKDTIIWYAWSSEQGGVWLYLGALLGALLTAVYSFRLVFIVFLGEERTPLEKQPGPMLHIALVVLAFLSITAGVVDLPEIFTRFTPLSDLLHHVLPPVRLRPETVAQEGLFAGISSSVTLLGVFLAWLFFHRRRDLAERFALNPVGGAIHRYLLLGWGFDWLYDRLFVRPYYWVARVNHEDALNLIYRAMIWWARATNWSLSATENGQVRLYAAVIAVGAVLILALTVFL